MPTFKDNAGREWTLKIDVPSIGHIRDETGVYLGSIEEFPALARDVVKMCKVVWGLVREQANAAAVKYGEFLEAMTKDAIPAAFGALTEAYLLFCPTAEEAELRRVMQEPTRESESKTSSATPGSSAESAESTPIPAA